MGRCFYVSMRTGEQCRLHYPTSDWLLDWQGRCRKHAILPRKELAEIRSTTLAKVKQGKCRAVRKDGHPCIHYKLGWSQWGFCYFHHSRQLREERKARRGSGARHAGGSAADSNAAPPGSGSMEKSAAHGQESSLR